MIVTGAYYFCTLSNVDVIRSLWVLAILMNDTSSTVMCCRHGACCSLHGRSACCALCTSHTKSALRRTRRHACTWHRQRMLRQLQTNGRHQIGWLQAQRSREHHHREARLLCISLRDTLTVPPFCRSVRKYTPVQTYNGRWTQCHLQSTKLASVHPIMHVQKLSQDA